MSKSNGSAPWVHLSVVKTKLVSAPGGLGGEGLVELVDVDVVLVESSLVEDLWDGVGRSDAHDSWWDTSHGVGDESADNWPSVLLGDGSSGQEDSGGSVGDLGGVSGGGDTSLLEGWFQLAKLLGGGAWSDSAVLGDGDLLLVALLVDDGGLDWDDLLIEPAVLLGVESSSVGLSGELVQDLSLEVVVLSDVLTKI